ncbi:hypothetical protein GCM10020218_050680 [Dactylosporangium vinaceum]
MSSGRVCRHSASIASAGDRAGAQPRGPARECDVHRPGRDPGVAPLGGTGPPHDAPATAGPGDEQVDDLCHGHGLPAADIDHRGYARCRGRAQNGVADVPYVDEVAAPGQRRHLHRRAVAGQLPGQAAEEALHRRPRPDHRRDAQDDRVDAPGRHRPGDRPGGGELRPRVVADRALGQVLGERRPGRLLTVFEHGAEVHEPDRSGRRCQGRHEPFDEHHVAPVELGAGRAPQRTGGVHDKLGSRDDGGDRLRRLLGGVEAHGRAPWVRPGRAAHHGCHPPAGVEQPGRDGAPDEAVRAEQHGAPGPLSARSAGLHGGLPDRRAACPRR